MYEKVQKKNDVESNNKEFKKRRSGINKEKVEGVKHKKIIFVIKKAYMVQSNNNKNKLKTSHINKQTIGWKIQKNKTFRIKEIKN